MLNLSVTAEISKDREYPGTEEYAAFIDALGKSGYYNEAPVTPGKGIDTPNVSWKTAEPSDGFSRASDFQIAATDAALPPVFSQANIHSDGFDLAVTHVKYIRGRGEEVMKQRHTGPQPKVLI
ncbi:hypothetical protein HOY80DRAFT_1133967 [Tuber brumale]|nr:hypothetical protein HOY80DRAFT_1133967 [Tuber brumale]